MPEKPIYLGGNPIVTDKVMRERHPFDFYETEPALVLAYFRKIDPNLVLFNVSVEERCRILDVGAGRGVWGKALRTLYPYAFITGIDIQPEFEQPPEYDRWITADYLTYKTDDTFDLIVGNPPYKHAEDFYWKSAILLREKLGDIVFLLRQGFLASRGRFDRMWDRYQKPYRVTVLNTRPSFTADGKTYPDDFCVINWTLKNGIYMGTTELDFMVYDR